MHGRAHDDVAGHFLRLSVPTLVDLSTSKPGARAGSLLTLTARVISLPAGPSPQPTGPVLFRAGAHVLGSAPLDDSGTATLTGVLLPPGVHALTAAYGGDTQHAGATSAPLPQAITCTTAPTGLVVSIPAQVPGGVRLAADVIDLRSDRVAGDACGVITFAAAGEPLGAAALFAGRAHVVVQDLPRGPVEATYTGDGEHAPARGLSPTAATAS